MHIFNHSCFYKNIFFNKCCCHVLLAIVLILLSPSLFGQAPINIKLRSGELSLTPNLRQDLIDKELDAGKTDQYYYTTVGFDRLPNLKSINYLKLSGAEFLEKLSDNVFVVRFRKAPTEIQLRTGGVKAIKYLPSTYKITTDLSNYIRNEHNDLIIHVSVMLYANEWNKQNQSLINSLGFDLTNQQYIGQAILVGNIYARQIDRLAALPFVKCVNLFNYKTEPLLVRETGVYALTNLTGKQNGGPNLSGNGITVGVGDNADPSSHIDLLNQLINRNPAPLQSSRHGTRVAGIISGDGLVDESYKGIAPSTQLVSEFFDYIITKAPIYKKDFGLSATNNSYFTGYSFCPGNGAYNELSSFVDEQLRQDSIFFHVFASGNDGELTCSPYPPFFATVKSGYQTAKNVLTVGSHNIITPDPQNISSFSSRGPVSDGRIKPEITASGSNVWSAQLNNNYNNGFGTSFSAPAVTAVYSLLAERFKQINNGSLPHSALMKAILCNTASDRGQPGPDYTNGYGLVNPYRALGAIENKRYIKGSLNQGQQISYNINVPSGTTQIKVMLYWHDPAGAPYASAALQHNLDLQVVNNGQVYLPWVLKPAPSLVANPAIRGVDLLNNIEQVTIDNPANGNIQIQINGSSVINGPQDFFVTWDYYNDDVRLLFPIGGEKFTPGINTNYEAITWDAPNNMNDSLLLEYSVDNGNNWILIADNVPVKSYWYWWTTPNVTVPQAKVRITRKSNNRQSVSPGTFTILPRNSISSIIPCEGAVNLSWNAVNNATDYDIYQLQDLKWEKIGTTSGLSYPVRGLNKSIRYWFSVCPKILDSSGKKSIAIAVTPNITTPCTSPEFDKDLKIDQLISPVNGRKNTSLELGANHKIIVKIKNLDDAPTSASYEVGYQINNGTIVREQSSITIPASSTIDYLFNATADLSAVDSFSIKVFVKQTGDLRTENDQQTFLVRQVDNPQIILPHIEDFESTDKDEYRAGSFAMKRMERFDYAASTSNGRLRTFVNTGMAPEGNKAITLDAAQYIGSANLNQLTGTFNLSNISLNEGTRLDFLFKNQGQLKLPTTALWVRGADTLAWIKAYEFDNSQFALGTIRKGWVNLYELLINAGQSLSSSFQIMVQQLGRSSSNNAEYYTELFDLDDGITFDQLRILNASNDLMLSAIITPEPIGCSSTTNQQTVAIKIKNNASVPLNNIPVSYRLENNSVVTEIIPSLSAGAEIVHTFSTPLTTISGGKYKLNAWVNYPMDDYPINDSILDYTFYRNGVINNYPYLERFETNNGQWFTTNDYSSWQWGSTDPNSRALITSAANGNNAWFTSLYSGYNSNESSYLYTPCFNLISLTNPVLSFSHISQQERGADFHLLEYSINNGLTWQRLGVSNIGTNWYDTTANYWNRSVQRWHVSSTDLPSGVANIRFRFLMSSNDFNQAEGIGIDDFHIFEKQTVYEGNNVIDVKQVSGNNFTHFVSQGNMVASINPLGQNLGTVNVSAFFNTDSVRLINNQYYLDRNLVIKSQFNPSDSVLVRFYFTDNEVNKMLFTTKCNSCIKLKDAYLTSVTKYNGADQFENGILNDGAGGTYEYIDASKVDIVPFNNGYYAEFKVKSFSEFWLHALNLNLSQLPVAVTASENSAMFIKNTMAERGGRIRIFTGNEPQIREMHIRLFNANGQQVYQSVKPYQYTDLYLPENAPGIYFIEITDRYGLNKYRNKLFKP